MKKKIKLLIVEDIEDDSLLIINQFHLSGYEVISNRVWTEESMRQILNNERWDAITCDHSMPGFDSVSALKVLLTSGLDIPFIIVSGSIGEVKAVEVMRAGANDYILKGSLERLVTATEREIREAKRREFQRKSEYAQKILSEVNAILISSLDYSITLHEILNLLVPKLVEGCIVDLFSDEELHFESYNLIDIKYEKRLLEIRKRFPPDLNDFDSAKLVSLVKDTKQSEYFKVLSDLGFNSVLFAPLRIRAKTTGLITFFISRKNKKFKILDLFLAVEIAQRLSMGIDNARLYQKSLEEIQLRDDFLMIASHELKTPVTSLKLKLQTLLRSFQRKERGNLSDEYIITSLKFVDRQISKFVKLIEELLNVSRIAKGMLELNLEVVNLDHVIYELANQFSEELKASGSSLDIEVTSSIIGFWDLLRIEQVIANLLSNAIKYGRGQPIKMSATIDGASALLTIEDHGMGIAKKDQSRIFNRYERAVSARNYGGLGMGLYISKQIIEAHGGTIVVESEIGVRTKFTICLPLVLMAEKAIVNQVQSLDGRGDGP